MITKKALAIRAAKALLPKPEKKTTSKKGCHNQPCTCPDHQVFATFQQGGKRQCHNCRKWYPPLKNCEHPRHRLVIIKRRGMVYCDRCAKILAPGVPADKFGDPLDKNAIITIPDLPQLAGEKF